VEDVNGSILGAGRASLGQGETKGSGQARGTEETSLIANHLLYRGKEPFIKKDGTP